MISYDDISERLPSNAVIDAVEKFPSGAIASDVSASAGVTLSQACKDLTILASLTRGDITVSADGELIYSFPSNIRGTLSSNSILEASGLDPNISTRELAQVMNDAGLPTRGAFDRENFISILQAQQQMQPQQKEVLQEEPYKLTLATDLNKIPSAGLGIVNRKFPIWSSSNIF